MVRFAREAHEDDPVNLEIELIDIFRQLGTPEALPFFIDLVRRNSNDVNDELVEAFVQLGAAAVDPLVELFHEIDGADAGDVPFVLSALRVRDPRILELLLNRLTADPIDAALCLEIYGDPAAIPHLEAAFSRIPAEDVRSREQIRSAIDELASPLKPSVETEDRFDIWDLYPQETLPDFGMLTEEERLAMLRASSPAVRCEAALSFDGSEPSAQVEATLRELARADPDVAVRGSCWQALGKLSDEPKLRDAMLSVLRNPDTSLEERAGAAVALSRNYEPDAVLIEVFEALYEEPRSRARALKAMGFSLDRRFADYPPRHLDDPDVEIKRQAITATGYLQLSSEAPRLEASLSDERFRLDALFAYALAIPGETSPGRARALLDKMEDIAGGFSADEEELVKYALDQRLMLRGKRPVFFEDAADDEPDQQPASTSKVGRNDPCPCGSGKKYKKCCGA